jgi:hypothetical protein
MLSPTPDKSEFLNLGYELELLRVEISPSGFRQQSLHLRELHDATHKLEVNEYAA